MTISGGRRADWAHNSTGVRNSRAPAADPAAMLPRLGQKFEITGRHAEGAICEVFKAHHTALDIAVAVKILRPEYSDDRRFLERMRVEAQVLSRFRHPHIPHCFDCGFTLDGRPFTVLEFLRGDTLEALLARAGRFDEPATIELGAALLRALDAAHNRGVVHRDVSLRNLIVHRTEHEPPTLKLIDFGFAWITPDAPESAPEPAEDPDCDCAVGTPRFTSPEVALGSPIIDGRADLYSTGVVLYTLLAGRDPFAELETVEAVLEAHAHREPPPLSSKLLHVSPDLEGVVMRLLEKDPADRFASADVAIQALRDAERTVRDSSRRASSTPPPRCASTSKHASAGSATGDHHRDVANTSIRPAPRALSTRRVDSLLLLRQTDRDPSDEEWNECLELLGSAIDAHHHVKVLVQTEGGRPTPLQRHRLGQITRKGDVRVAVVSESTKVRFGVSVVALLKMKIRTFLTAELTAAYDHLGLSETERALAETHLAEMAALLPLSESPDPTLRGSRDGGTERPFREPMDRALAVPLSIHYAHRLTPASKHSGKLISHFAPCKNVKSGRYSATSTHSSAEAQNFEEVSNESGFARHRNGSRKAISSRARGATVGPLVFRPSTRGNVVALAIEPQFKDPHIKGSVIRSAKEWIIKTYGPELFERALAPIPKEMRDTVSGEILSVGWYPLATWTTFMDSVRREVKRSTGEEPDEFDRRNIFEAGRNTIVTVYRFVLGVLDPTAAVGKILPVLRRIYSHGDIKLVSHTPGTFIVRFVDAPLSMQSEVTRQFPLASEFMLHAAGQQVTSVRPTLKTEGTTFSLELELKYRKA